ncbi:MAG: hypothetical protein KA217_09330 [Gammaproteobacteria bacterium]|nr:hypothetical protein [Gammaproteobacteria bacterium]
MTVESLPKKVWLSLGIALVLALTLAGKRYLDTRVAPGFTLIDSRTPVADRQMYWLDDDRVLFLGGETVREGRDFGKLRQALMIFDVPKRKTTVYRRDVQSLLCVADGRVVYAAHEEGEEKRYAGELGKEVHTPWKTKQEVDAAPDVKFNPLTCGFFDHAAYKTAGKQVKPLRGGDGVLDLGRPEREEWTDRNSIRLVRGSDHAVVELPVERRQAYHVHYAPYRGAYLLARFINQSSTIEWSRKGCEPMWWLAPDGRTEKECMPYLPSLSFGLGHVVPWRDGVLFAHHRGAGQWGPGDAGLYIWNRGDGLLRRVLPGVVSHGVTGHPAVSPDGCRVAFGYARNMGQNRPRTRTLRVLELCQGGKSDGQGRPQPDCAGCEPRGVR